MKKTGSVILLLPLLRHALCHLTIGFALFSLLAAPIALAGFEEGRTAYYKEDYPKALREFRPLAQKGDASAQYNLGLMYANGQGVTQDYQEALKWYRLAAAQRYAAAQFLLGEMYINGKGVAQSDQEAFKWFRLAADQGNGDSQSVLGTMYRDVQGER